MRALSFTAIGLTAILTGCASIVGEREQAVTINSTPDDAQVTITDEQSEEIHSGETPVTVQLKKSDGSYFGGKTYTVDVSKPGIRVPRNPYRVAAEWLVCRWQSGLRRPDRLARRRPDDRRDVQPQARFDRCRAGR